MMTRRLLPPLMTPLSLIDVEGAPATDEPPVVRVFRPSVLPHPALGFGAPPVPWPPVPVVAPPLPPEPDVPGLELPQPTITSDNPKTRVGSLFVYMRSPSVES